MTDYDNLPFKIERWSESYEQPEDAIAWGRFQPNGIGRR
jgi:hypothetical protein